MAKTYPTRPIAQYTPTYAKYINSYYYLYDYNKPQYIILYTAAFIKFSDFDNYILYINPTLTLVDYVLTTSIRLDDLILSKVLITSIKIKDLYKNQPADLDKNSIPRATRAPLGLAVKIFIPIRDINIKGDVYSKKDEGYYYLQQRGLYLLYGAKVFLVILSALLSSN